MSNQTSDMENIILEIGLQHGDYHAGPQVWPSTNYKVLGAIRQHDSGLGSVWMMEINIP